MRGTRISRSIALLVSVAAFVATALPAVASPTRNLVEDAEIRVESTTNSAAPHVLCYDAIRDSDSRGTFYTGLVLPDDTVSNTARYLNINSPAIFLDNTADD